MIDENESIYLDYAAATPMSPQVIDAMAPYLSDCFHNPSAPYAAGRKARRALEDARARLAHAIGGKPAQVTLTAGATEANNLAFAATSGHVVASAIEHESTLACAKARNATLVDVSSEGLIDAADVAAAIRPDTQLVSIALANGEIGTIQPLRDIAAVVRAERERRLAAGDHTPLWLHTDATQAAGVLAVNVASLGVDAMTLSAAKLYGPKQVGLLWTAEGLPLQPLVLGGGQENGVRSGTENVAGAVGFACALEAAQAARKEEAARLGALRDKLQSMLASAFGDVVVSGPRKRQLRLPQLLHVSFPGIEAQRLVILLEAQGMYVGTGSACAASKMRTSHVLEAIGLPPATANGSLRITLGAPTTEEQIERAGACIIDAVRTEKARLGMDTEVQHG